MNRKLSRLLLLDVFIAFGLYSAWVLWDVGYIGIFTSHLSNAGGIQVLCDLTIALGLVCVWMVNDARSRCRNPWPFVLLTLVAGSFGPLLYLLLRRSSFQRSAEDAPKGLLSRLG